MMFDSITTYNENRRWDDSVSVFLYDERYGLSTSLRPQTTLNLDLTVWRKETSDDRTDVQ